MGNPFTSENLSIFLPKYLTEDLKEGLKAELNNFNNGEIVKSIYTSELLETESIYQGDGLSDLLTINLPEEKISSCKGLVVSNTCDIDIHNTRYFPAMIMYSPILKLDEYLKMLKSSNIYDSTQINQHVESIRKQEITQILYLPARGIEGECIVFLDRICHCSNESINRNNLKKIRIFTLSTFGHYLLLFKLSIHFTRMNDKVIRGMSEIIQ